MENSVINLQKGPKQAPWNGWNASTSCTGNFVVIAFSLIHLSTTKKEACFGWPPNNKSNGFSLTSLEMFSN